MRPDYCPIGNQPCQSLCDTPCTATPKREWVGLTGVEVNHIFAENVGYPERMMKEVEAKLKEKNI